MLKSRRLSVAILLPALGVLASCSSGGEATPVGTVVTETAPPTTKAADASASSTAAAAPGDATTTAAPTTQAAAAADCPKADGSSPKTQKFATEPPTCIDAAKTYTVTMETSKGTMTFVLDQKKAPKTVNSFVFLTRYHYFDGITFHRVVKDFVIQGGDPEGTGAGGPGYQFADELPDQGEYKVGSLAMANAGPNTNGSQFFIITGANGAALPPNYSLFGQLKSGEDVMQAINALSNATDGPPTETITMTKVTVAES